MPVLYFIGFFVIFGLITIIVVILNKEEKIKDEKDIYFNLGRRDLGSAYGIIKDLKYNVKYDRYRLEGEARDQSLRDLLDKKPPKKIKCIIDKGKILSFPKNKFSPGKNIHIILPKSAKDFNKEFLAVNVGKELSNYVELLNSNNVIINSLQEQIKRLHYHVENLAGGEVGIEHLENIKSNLKSLVNLTQEIKKPSSAYQRIDHSFEELNASRI